MKKACEAVKKELKTHEKKDTGMMHKIEKKLKGSKKK